MKSVIEDHMTADLYTAADLKEAVAAERERWAIEREGMLSDMQTLCAEKSEGVAAERERWTRNYAELEARYKALIDTMVEQRHMVLPPAVIIKNDGAAVAAERARCANKIERLMQEAKFPKWGAELAAAIRKGEGE